MQILKKKRGHNKINMSSLDIFILMRLTSKLIPKKR